MYSNVSFSARVYSVDSVDSVACVYILHGERIKEKKQEILHSNRIRIPRSVIRYNPFLVLDGLGALESQMGIVKQAKQVCPHSPFIQLIDSPESPTSNNTSLKCLLLRRSRTRSRLFIERVPSLSGALGLSSILILSRGSI